jgi:hypothetical protein
LHHIIVKISIVQKKERILKASRGKHEVICKGNPIQKIAELSAEILKTKRAWT